MENILTFIQTNSGIVVIAVAIGSLIFKAGLWMANIDKKIDASSTKIDSLTKIVEKNYDGNNERMDKIETNFKSIVQLKLKD